MRRFLRRQEGGEVRQLFRTNPRLWLGISACLVVTQSFLPLVRSGGEVFNYWTAWGVVFRGGSFIGTPADTVMILVLVALRYVITAALVGWVAQRVVLAVAARQVVDSTPNRPHDLST